MSRKRFPGWSFFNCSQDSLCSASVKGTAILPCIPSDDGTGNGRRQSGAVVNLQV